MATSKPPTVLVSSYYIPSPTNPARWFMAGAAMAYCDSVRLAGGFPLIAPPLDDDAEVREALSRAAAVLLIGGPDLDPQSYGQARHPRTEAMHRRRNDSDLRLAKAAAESGKPTLGICGGLQALNVALGGTLHQHIPDVPGLCGADDHSLVAPDDNRHQVRLSPESRLARAMGITAVEVNSSHHQAIDRLARGLRAVAWSQTGLIEAVEGPADGPFLVATQWHPERMAMTPTGEDRGGRPTAGRADQLGIFRALVEAGRKVQ